MPPISFYEIVMNLRLYFLILYIEFYIIYDIECISVYGFSIRTNMTRRDITSDSEYELLNVDVVI